MPDNKKHLTNEEILLFSDQELPVRTASRARQHLAGCETCRGRLKKVDIASAAFADFHEREIQAQKFYPSDSRNLLKARLSESSRQIDESRTAIFGNPAPQLVAACLTLLLALGGIWTVLHVVRARSNRGAMQADALTLPRRALTPGSTRPVQIGDLCGNQNIANDPPVNSSLEHAVLKEYGVPNTLKMDYELDYLITPSLGGADNIQNLWPQPYSTIWNARVKDQLESHLHELVCQGQIQLTTAQNDIASDWIAAYKRYFNTDKPLLSPSNRSSIVDPRRELYPLPHRNSASGV
jgi:hypothetical protein